MPHQSIKSSFSGAGMICTADGRYLITFGGGKTGIWKTDAIILHDLEDHTAAPIVSPLRCPAKGRFYALTMMTDTKHDEILAFGFVRQSFNEPGMKGVQLPPLYLIQMMAQWVETESVHLLPRDTCRNEPESGHWKMRVDPILNSII